VILSCSKLIYESDVTLQAICLLHRNSLEQLPKSLKLGNTITSDQKVGGSNPSRHVLFDSPAP
jgi:hypothetical protein